MFFNSYLLSVCRVFKEQSFVKKSVFLTTSLRIQPAEKEVNPFCEIFYKFHNQFKLPYLRHLSTAFPSSVLCCSVEQLVNYTPCPLQVSTPFCEFRKSFHFSAAEGDKNCKKDLNQLNSGPRLDFDFEVKTLEFFLFHEMAAQPEGSGKEDQGQKSCQGKQPLLRQNRQHDAVFRISQKQINQHQSQSRSHEHEL